MKFLFVKHALTWPRSSGHDVQCYHLMKALADAGADISLATVVPVEPAAIDGLRLARCEALPTLRPPAGFDPGLTRLQERFRSFWGVDREHIAATRALCEALQADVLVAFGLPALPFLAGGGDAVRIWGMADEWVYHHLSLVRWNEPATWPHLKAAAIKGLYERTYAPMVDRVWAVSETDARAARRIAGLKTVDVLPNGVDTAFYQPVATAETPRSAVFWGRLDFEPNIDAATWFCREVWPLVRARHDDATFTIMGYQPGAAVRALADLPGVRLRPDVEDLRTPACAHALVVLPMISGGGIKNKLLEAAALGRPIVCTARAALDLEPRGALPLKLVERPADWARALTDLWADDDRRRALGAAARQWVSTRHAWAVPARRALDALEAAGPAGVPRQTMRLRTR